MTEEINYSIEPIGLDGLKKLVQWAREEGWNPGLNDAEVFYNTDPDGFLGLFVNGEMVGGGSIVSYHGNFGFMGFFIMMPEYRGKGLGHRLWYNRRDKLISRLHPGAAIGMDGVVQMQPFYKKGGFSIAFRDERYEMQGEKFTIHSAVTPILPEDHEAVFAFDTICFGTERRKFMTLWLQMPDMIGFSYKENNELQGFALMRKCVTGYRICPLFARNPTVAEELLKACLNVQSGQPVYIDIPVSNREAVNLVNKYDAKYVFECARMYYGNQPILPIEYIYGITSFELG